MRLASVFFVFSFAATSIATLGLPDGACPLLVSNAVSEGILAHLEWVARNPGQVKAGQERRARERASVEAGTAVDRMEAYIALGEFHTDLKVQLLEILGGVYRSYNQQNRKAGSLRRGLTDVSIVLSPDRSAERAEGGPDEAIAVVDFVMTYRTSVNDFYRIQGSVTVSGSRREDYQLFVSIPRGAQLAKESLTVQGFDKPKVKFK